MLGGRRTPPPDRYGFRWRLWSLHDGSEGNAGPGAQRREGCGGPAVRRPGVARSGSGGSRRRGGQCGEEQRDGSMSGWRVRACPLSWAHREAILQETGRRGSELSAVAAQSATPGHSAHRPRPTPRGRACARPAAVPPHPRQAANTLPLRPGPCEKADRVQHELPRGPVLGPTYRVPLQPLRDLLGELRGATGGPLHRVLPGWDPNPRACREVCA